MGIDPRFGRYPFFQGAQAAVRALDQSPAALIAHEAPAVSRGKERVERALLEGTTAPPDSQQHQTKTELLSYPIARLLVSLLDVSTAIDKYALAEARTARERFEADFTDDEVLQSTTRTTVDVQSALSELELADAVESEPLSASTHRSNRWYWVELVPYLQLREDRWGDQWRLVNQELANGAVRVRYTELMQLLEAAVKQRVASELPLSVEEAANGAEIIEGLSTHVADLQALVDDRPSVTKTTVDVVVPAMFPPCMRGLLQMERSDETLSEPAKFAFISFLLTLGADRQEIAAPMRCPADSTELAARVEYLQYGAGTQYPPPSCQTMKRYDICLNPDERCENIDHPSEYYEAAIEETDSIRDWRESTVEG